MVVPDKQFDQGAKQGFASFPDIVSEFKEAKSEREFFRSDAAMRPKPASQKRAEAFHRIR
jgi:hypothetical protein